MYRLLPALIPLFISVASIAGATDASPNGTTDKPAKLTNENRSGSHPALPPSLKAPAQAPVDSARVWYVPRALSVGEWNVHAGYVFRSLGSLSSTTESYALRAGLPLLVSDADRVAGLAGSGSALSNHFYSDGYVRPDGGTAASGETAFFGFQSSSQQQGNALVFHGVGDLVTILSRDLSVSPTADTDLLANGVAIGVGYDVPLRDGWHIGADFSVEFVRANDSVDHRTFTERQTADTYSSRVIDRYFTGGVALPASPYAGTFTSLGPLISGTPNRSENVRHTLHEQAVLFDEVSDALDLSLTTLSLGPTVRLETKGWQLTGGIGLAINVASWDADSRQVLKASINGGRPRTLASWTDHNSGVDILPGIYAQVGARRVIDEQWSVELAVRYDWCRSLHAEAGGSRLELDMSGWSLMAQATYRFKLPGPPAVALKASSRSFFSPPTMPVFGRPGT